MCRHPTATRNAARDSLALPAAVEEPRAHVATIRLLTLGDVESDAARRAHELVRQRPIPPPNLRDERPPFVNQLKTQLSNVKHSAFLPRPPLAALRPTHPQRVAAWIQGAPPPGASRGAEQPLEPGEHAATMSHPSRHPPTPSAAAAATAATAAAAAAAAAVAVAVTLHPWRAQAAGRARRLGGALARSASRGGHPPLPYAVSPCSGPCQTPGIPVRS